MLTNKSVYLFSGTASSLFPMIIYTNANYTSRFMHLFWLPGLTRLNSLSATHYPQEDVFVKLITDDLNKNTPDLIFVDITDYKIHFDYRIFDYRQYFAKFHPLNEILNSYHYLTTIESPVDYTQSINNWQLYSLDNLNELNSFSLKGNSVIVVGKGNHRLAYLAQANGLIIMNHRYIYQQILLTPTELNLLSQQHGLIQKKPAEFKEISSLINKSVQFPFYKYAVYER